MNLHKLREDLLHSGRLEEFLDQIGLIRHNAEKYEPFPMRGPESLDRHRYEATMKMREWAHKIPSIQFPADWHVTIMPPFTGATIRFMVTLERMDPERETAHTPGSVSVYLDCYNNLGLLTLGEPTPYWEVYPVSEDIERFALEEIDELVECIRNSLADQAAPSG